LGWVSKNPKKLKTQKSKKNQIQAKTWVQTSSNAIVFLIISHSSQKLLPNK
jgi:hypothetical protein